MLVLAPALSLALGLLVLVGLRRWRPAFKAYWLMAVAASALATLLVLALRLGLPHSVDFAGWRLAESQQFPFKLGLDAFSWPLALAAALLALAALLGGVRRAPSADWLTWLPALALGAASLLAVSSGDLLAFAFTLFLHDVLALMLGVSAEEPARLVRRFAFGLFSIVLVLLAWAAPASYATFGNLMLLIALALRLGAAARLWKAAGQNSPLRAPLRLAAQVAALALLALVQPLAAGLLSFALLLLLVISTWAALRGLGKPSPDAWPYLIAALAGLALAAAICGAPAAALAFGLLALFAPSLPGLLGAYPRARLPWLAVCAFVLSGLPLSPLSGANLLYAQPASPLAYAFLLPHALALAGVLRAAAAERTAVLPEERWTRGVETIGAVLPAAFFVLLGLGLAPRLAEAAPPFWPGLVALALAVGLRLAAAGGLSLLPPHAHLPHISAVDLARVGRSLWLGLRAALAFTSALLEGEAGLLWALLLIALLISVAAQSGFAG